MACHIGHVEWSWPWLLTLCSAALQMVQSEFRGRGGQHAYHTIMLHTQPSIPSSLKFKWAAPEMVEGALYDDKDGPPFPHTPAIIFSKGISPRLPALFPRRNRPLGACQ